MIKIIYILLPILLILFITKVHSEVQNLTPEQVLKAQSQGVIVIDIRTPKEWQHVGIISGAARILFYDEKRNAKIPEFMQQFEKLVTNKDQPFILVCRTGSRTSRATKFLENQKGYTHGAHLAKGMKQWLAENRPVEKIQIQ